MKKPVLVAWFILFYSGSELMAADCPGLSLQLPGKFVIKREINRCIIRSFPDEIYVVIARSIAVADINLASSALQESFGKPYQKTLLQQNPPTYRYTLENNSNLLYVYSMFLGKNMYLLQIHIDRGYSDEISFFNNIFFQPSPVP